MITNRYSAHDDMEKVAYLLRTGARLDSWCYAPLIYQIPNRPTRIERIISLGLQIPQSRARLRYAIEHGLLVWLSSIVNGTINTADEKDNLFKLSRTIN